MRFLDCDECKEIFAGREIYVFGAGVDGEKLYQKLADTVNICAFIDNKRYGKGNYLCGKEIINLEQYRQRKTGDQPIIVAAYRFMVDISEQLVKEGFVPEKDFFIWDDHCIHHANTIAKQYIKFMSDIWGEKKREQTDRIVLVPFDSRHDQNSVQYAYLSNFLAEKYDASIYGFCRYGASVENASSVVFDIYKAFNVVGLIDSSLNKEMQKESDDILRQVWENLYTWKDWKDLTVYGICFGTTVIRDFLREDLPDYDMRSQRIYNFIKKTIDSIVFWYHYIMEHDIVTVLLADGVCWEGYIRDIAITKEIPTYAVEYTMERAYLDFHGRTDACLYYKEMWQQLTSEEQRYGIQWAKERIHNRIKGNSVDVDKTSEKIYSFSQKFKEDRILDNDDKIKIIICPHIFEEDSVGHGEQIFDNSYMEWLCHLGELSEKTPDYHWYLKMHPCSRRRDVMIIENYVKRYPKIKILPLDISPIQLKEEGADFALTVHGTIGHEYPAIGIQVINAGNNPHIAFDFTWNPKTKEEYDHLIMNLSDLEPKDNMEELYQFYSMHYLFYDREYIPYTTMFYDNPLLPLCMGELEVYGKELGTWKYEEYMKEWTVDRHMKLWDEIEDLFQKMDCWKPNIFYRKNIEIDYMIGEEG
jgi:hypothetical protein